MNHRVSPRLHDTVRLVEPVSDGSVRVGAIGVIVAIFSVPEEAYEVEFANPEGETIAQIALRPNEFVIIKSMSSGD